MVAFATQTLIIPMKHSKISLGITHIEKRVN